MFTGSIKISELNPLGIVVANDFFPLVDSGSATTYRVNITTLNAWWAISGSALSSSWASSSISAIRSVSSSWASASLTSLQTISASWASASLTSLQTISASWASSSISASFSLKSISASFAPFTQSVQISASYASASLSASYAFSASYAPSLSDTVPIGTIMAFGSASVPANWLECNGDAKSTSSFSELFNAIRTNDTSASFGYLCDGFGNRNSSGGFFKLPDFRGEFLRGWDHNRGVDIGRLFATSQTSSAGTHYHGIGTFDLAGGDDCYFVLKTWNDGFSYLMRRVTGAGGFLSSTRDGSDASSAISTTNPSNVSAGDIRPRNVGIMYCIKYSNVINYAATGITLAGDVVGTGSATNVVAIQNIPVTSLAPLDGQILIYNATSSKWEPTSPTVNNSVIARAYGTVLQPVANDFSSYLVACTYNANSIALPSATNIINTGWEVSLGCNPLHVVLPGRTIIITFTNPMPTPYYSVVYSTQGYEPYGFESVLVYYSPVGQTVNGFTMSYAGGDSTGTEARYIAGFVVYHPS